jgi:hypothetical protein
MHISGVSRFFCICGTPCLLQVFFCQNKTISIFSHIRPRFLFNSPHYRELEIDCQSIAVIKFNSIEPAAQPDEALKTGKLIINLKTFRCSLLQKNKRLLPPFYIYPI